MVYSVRLSSARRSAGNATAVNIKTPVIRHHCDKCGVEVTRSSVRRERMGTYAGYTRSPLWYTRRIPSTLFLISPAVTWTVCLYFAQ